MKEWRNLMERKKRGTNRMKKEEGLANITFKVTTQGDEIGSTM
jgi:hypothetical protein